MSSSLQLLRDFCGLGKALRFEVDLNSALVDRGGMSDPAHSTRIYRLPILARGLIWVGSILVRLLCGTLRYQLVDEARFLENQSPRPVIILIWHNRILAMPVAFRRFYRKRKGLQVLTSASRDGAYLSEFVRCFGMGAIRGSSSRRGAAALLDLVRNVEDGFDICITPDGPRGPRYKLGPGALMLAEKCGVPLLPVNVEYSAFWRFNSWDGFAVPKPFSKVTVTVLPMIDVGTTGSEGAFAEKLKAVETRMTERMLMK
jgi:lysophospholipid acyltransferase (LPLAT)-like uncharacterized protein